MVMGLLRYSRWLKGPFYGPVCSLVVPKHGSALLSYKSIWDFPTSQKILKFELSLCRMALNINIY